MTLPSLSIVWHGKMYVFGGHTEHWQISVVDQCQLKSIGELQFLMRHGACAQRNNAEIFICFEDYHQSDQCKNCYRSKGPLEKFEKLPSSTYSHDDTRIAVNSGKPIS